MQKVDEAFASAFCGIFEAFKFYDGVNLNVEYCIHSWLGLLTFIVRSIKNLLKKCIKIFLWIILHSGSTIRYRI